MAALGLLLFIASLALWVVLLRRARNRPDHRRTWFVWLVALPIVPLIIPGGLTIMWAVLAVYWFRHARQPQSNDGERVPHTLQGPEGFLKCAAWVLKTAARVEGKGSPEWDRALLTLMSLANGQISRGQASRILDNANISDLLPELFTEEERLVLLRIAIDIALADESITSAEQEAIEDLATQLHLAPQIVAQMIRFLTGEDPDRRDQLENAYMTLGVQPGAPVGEIRTAWMRLVKEHHPDTVSPHQRDEATRRTADINAAYELLIGKED